MHTESKDRLVKLGSIAEEYRREPRWTLAAREALG